MTLFTDMKCSGLSVRAYYPTTSFTGHIRMPNKMRTRKKQVFLKSNDVLTKKQQQNSSVNLHVHSLKGMLCG